ncbi:S41 family peptidase [Sphingomicrobium astaxanthinifaciens]|uniref:S41 family peptidase n=1 Tax=Sphingomicrobium astaxanthinifaciens TaxID=1227949 RepID=UPI001FCBEEE1|nr:S41 family peptidase [Sphingomicrobium astaxanthinifaciens]MCJ7421525.1 S41 family peptidase [Sphingomicrobium astaxanthinifaciens]
MPGLERPAEAQNEETYRELENFLSVFERVRANYVEEVSDADLIRGAIEGMLSSLDPHSSYLTAADFATMRLSTDGEYGGLGLTVTNRDGAVFVIAPTEDTPADRAGIKAGDYITHIDDELLFGLSLDEAVAKMRGEPGTEVILTIVRPGRTEPFDVAVKREIIDLKPVKWEVDGDVGIININQFSAPTAEGVAAAIRGIDRAIGGDGPVGYVVDLRANPGGLLNQAVEVTDLFLDRGEIVSERGRDPADIDRFYATKGDLTGGKPVIVLIDAGSASASEIVAGALQDHRRAVVMGETSFGKGSVQTIIQTGETSALRLTTARYYTPSGRSVQAGGIEPDIVVPQLSDPDRLNRPRLREADLRRHLVAQAGVEDAVLEDDSAPDPRFLATPAELEEAGIEDFQLHYAIETLERLNRRPQRVASAR